MYRVVVHKVAPIDALQEVFYTETFDAPDWQTALIAAAEAVKVIPDKGFDCPVCIDLLMEQDHADYPDPQLGDWAHGQYNPADPPTYPASTCDLDDGAADAYEAQITAWEIIDG